MSRPRIDKRVLNLGRERRPPAEGWSWIDRRFVREVAPRLCRDAILLYFFLAAVSDRRGLSYWGDAAIAARLRLEEPAIHAAREELVRSDLVAWEPPLTQVLSLPTDARAFGADGPRGLAKLLGLRPEGRP